VIEQHPHGVWLVDLAALSDVRLLDQTIAAACGIIENRRRAVVDVLFPHVLSAQPSVVALALWPLAVMFLPVADSFAGERERGTLEVLLLSPVPDWVVPAAKLLVLYIEGLVFLAVLLPAHIVVALLAAGGTPSWTWYAAAAALGVALYPLLISLGLLVSWSVSSVQAAQAIVVYVPFALLTAGGSVIARIASDAHVSISAPPEWAGPGAILVTAIASASTSAVVLLRFRRHALLLKCRQTFGPTIGNRNRTGGVT
jgi:ABC-type transport system involved in multi-copper enzyme maturation permease subunit